MPKAKPISLHPLSFDEAIKALIRVNPEGPTKEKKKRTTKQQSKRKKAP